MGIQNPKSEIKNRENGIATSDAWRAAAQSEREARAEPLRLPSGATILAVKPEPLEWIMSGRVPQRLLGAALESAGPAGAEREMTREEILDLAKFATRLVRASVVRPALGDGPDEIALEDIPIEDRAYIFEWACRALGRRERIGAPGPRDNSVPRTTEEDLSSPACHAGLERFREK